MPLKPERFRRLAKAVGPSFKALKPFRDAAADIQKQYAGPHYGQYNNVDSRPVNMMELALIQHANELSSSSPQVICLTDSPRLKAAANELELALNVTLERIGFAKEHRMWVMSALMGVGIMQVGLETVERPVVDAEMLPLTNVFVETIMLDDWVHDMNAKKWNTRQVTFCGHRYQMSLDEAKENPDFDEEVRKQLGKRGAPFSGAMESLAHESELEDSFTDMVDLWDIWVPEDRVVVTFAAHEQGKTAASKPLRVLDWKGPDHGPYHLLGFNPILNNVMPLAPAANWYDIDDLFNKLVKELGVEASQTKSLGIVGMQGKDDAQRIKTAASGSIVCLDNPQQFTTQTFGGVNQQNMQLALTIKSLASYAMGNLDALAGLGQQGSTLGQEQIIKSSSSGRIRSMQTAVAEATELVIRDIASYLHKHPTVEMDLTLQVQGSSVKIPIKWPHQQDENGIEFDSREGDLDDYRIKIIPYSMQELTPGARAQTLERIYMQIIMPVVASGQPAPEGFDEFLRILAKYYSMPEIADIYQPSQPIAETRPAGGTERGGGIRPPTNSTYTRKSVAAPMSQQKMDQQMQLAMMGGGGSMNIPKAGA